MSRQSTSIIGCPPSTSSWLARALIFGSYSLALRCTFHSRSLGPSAITPWGGSGRTSLLFRSTTSWIPCVKWTSMGLVRIGVEGESVDPVIIWIGVKLDTLSVKDGLATAKESKKLLVANDLQVEIQESVVWGSWAGWMTRENRYVSIKTSTKHCDDKVCFLFHPKWCPLLKSDSSRLSQYRNEILVAHLQFQLDIRASGEPVHHFSALWRAVSWIIEDGYVSTRLKLPSSNLGLSFLPQKFNLRFGFPATVLASLEYLEHFISYLALRIRCPVYYIPPTHLSHLRSLTTP